MEGELVRIALVRAGVIPVAPGPATPLVVTALLRELAAVGIRVTNPEALTDATAATVATVAATERARRGEHGTFSPLFKGFPDQLPDWDDATTRFTFGVLRLLGTGAERGGLTDDDVRAAMDLSAVGWWPASSVPQDVERTAVDRAIQQMLPGDTVEQVTALRAVPADRLAAEVRAWMAAAFAAPTSLRADVREDLRTAAGLLGVDHVDPASARFRETATLLHELVWRQDPARLAGAGLGPDDLLRLFAQLTGTDASLGGRVSVPRLTRRERRAVMAVLEASPRRGDVFRRRGLWLAVARGLHPHEHADRAPVAAELFARLHGQRRDQTALGSRVERALGEDRFTDAVGALAAEAPGALVRSLRRLGRLAAGDPARERALLGGLEGAAGAVPLSVLLVARAELADNLATGPRLALTKGGRVLPLPGPGPWPRGGSAIRAALFEAGYPARVAPGAQPLPGPLADALVGALAAAAARLAAAKPSWAGERVWVDPELSDVLLPTALRATGEGLVQVERGSRLALGEAPVLRLFCHWRQPEGERSDLDLSVVLCDEGFEVVDRVSWTRLATAGAVHSGDVTSAPVGAQEFVDLRLDGLARGVRYAVPAVLRYAGPAFAGLPEAAVGWCLREEASADRATFDPKTVVNAMPLTGRRTVALPMAVDLAARTVLSTDLYLRTEPGATVERDAAEFVPLLQALAVRRATRPGVADVVALHVAARGGETVADRSEATLTFGLDAGATFDALHPEALLAELL